MWVVTVNAQITLCISVYLWHHQKFYDHYIYYIFPIYMCVYVCVCMKDFISEIVG
jgi:hypothetical protein